MTASHQDITPNAFGIDVGRQDGRPLVTVRGELDIATVPALERALDAQAEDSAGVVLDLRALGFIDAAGLRLLLRADANARRAGTPLQLMTSAPVRRLFALCDVAPPAAPAPAC